MIDHVWTVICSNVVIDKESNNVSLHNILEQLTVHKRVSSDEKISVEDVPSEMVIPYSFTVVTLWSRSNLSEKVIGYGRVRLFSPDGEPLIGLGEFEINLYNNRRFRSKGKFRGFPSIGAGKYTFVVDVRIDEDADWEQVASVPVEVRFAENVDKE